MNSIEILSDLLLASPGDASTGVDWLRTQLGKVRERPDPGLLNALPGARRRLGDGPLVGVPDALDTPDGGLPLAQLDRGTAGRILLVCAAADSKGGPEAVEAAYHQGDPLEQVAVLRALSLLAEPARYLPLALDACRTNTVTLFEGIACENPYPVAQMTEAQLNQMVLKSIFIGVAVDRIQGLARRYNAELGRMASDYIDEREAAGRSVSPDLWPLIGAHPPDGGLARLTARLGDADPAQRAAAARGLGLCGDASALAPLQSQLESEAAPDVRARLEAAIAALQGA